MTMGKPLLFVTSRLPFPPNSGRKVSLYHYCRGLAARGYDVYLYVFPEWDQKRSDAEKPDFIREVRFAAPVGKLRRVVNLFFKSLLGGAPLQCALFDSPQNRRAIRAYAKEIGAEVVITDMVRLAPYFRAVRSLSCRKIADLDDLLSLRYARQKESASGADAAGHFAGNMPSFLRKCNCGALGKLILGTEARRVRRAEKRYARLYDAVILVSEREADLLNAWIGEKKAFAVPMGVDADYFAALPQEKDPAAIGEKPLDGIAFVGNLHVAANQDSLRFLAREVLPLMKNTSPIRLIGPVPDEIRAEFSDLPRLVFVGEVPDLRPAVKKNAVSLLPVSYGSGIKTKVLESMAMGVPVVTNPVGAENIDAVPGEHFFVENSPAALADRVDELLGDPEKRRAIAKNAAALVREKYDWGSIFERFSDVGL